MSSIAERCRCGQPMGHTGWLVCFPEFGAFAHGGNEPADEFPWHTEEHVTRAMEEMRNHLARESEAHPTRCGITSYEHRCRNLRDEFLRTAGQDVLADLARVALGMKPERR